jgi:ketosteroid isomerase-like protein
MTIEAVQRSYEAFARDDLDGALAMMDEDIVWHQAQGLPHGGTYHGLAAVRANVFDPIDESWWVGFKADPEEVIGLGDVLGRYTATSKETGRPLDVPFVHVWRFRDGRAVCFHQFTDTYGWREALTVPGTA